jgi:hypothetical protein
MIVIVEYPTPDAFLSMVTSEEYRVLLSPCFTVVPTA